MRVFVTGATGFVGSAVTAELIAAGHQVTGLARSERSSAALKAMKAEIHQGTLEDTASLRAGAESADAVIHTGFIHDFSRFKENCEIDRLAIEALGEALAGTGRPLIVTSGTGLLSPGGLATEETPPAYGGSVPRVSEQTALSLVASGVRASVIRLPPSVHGAGDHGFVPLLIGIAREKGEAAYVGEGLNVWPAVHRLDAARLYVQVLEKGEAGGRYHAVGEEGVPFRDIATAIGRGLGLPVVSKSGDAASAYFGWFTHFAGIDNRSSSAWTQSAMGWTPTGPGLIADIDGAGYFEG